MGNNRKVLITVSRDYHESRMHARIVADRILTSADGNIPMAERRRLELLIAALASETKLEGEPWDFQHDATLQVQVELAIEIPGKFGQYSWFSTMIILYRNGHMDSHDRDWLWRTITRLLNDDVKYDPLPQIRNTGGSK